MRVIENDNFKEQNYSYNLANRKFAGEDIKLEDPITLNTYKPRPNIMDFSKWKDEGGGAGAGSKERVRPFNKSIEQTYPYGMGKQQTLNDFYNNENIINERPKQEEQEEEMNLYGENNDDEDSKESKIIETNINLPPGKGHKKKIGKYKYYDPVTKLYYSKPHKKYLNPKTNEYQSEPPNDYNATEPIGNYTEPIQDDDFQISNNDLIDLDNGNNLFDYGLGTAIGIGAAWARNRWNREIQNNWRQVFRNPQ
jgi:hypothetical protein